MHGEFLLAKTASASTTSSPKAKLIFDGSTTATQKYYPVLNNVAISTGSHVVVLKIAGSYIILGKIQST